MTGKVADLRSVMCTSRQQEHHALDPESPFVTSGLRPVPPLTTRGFDVDAFREVADVITDRLLNPEYYAIQARFLEGVSSL